MLHRWSVLAAEKGAKVGLPDLNGRIPLMSLEHVSAERAMLELAVPFQVLDHVIGWLKTIGGILVVAFLFLFLKNLT